MASTSDDDDEHIEVPPTCKKVLQAMFVLCKYMNVLNDLLAHTVEMTLGLFTWKIHMEEMHNMKVSRLALLGLTEGQGIKEVSANGLSGH